MAPFLYNNGKYKKRTPMNQTFSKTLRKLREAKGLSQQALADKMFVTRPTIARWEAGTRLPDAMMIYRLAEVLGEDVNVLLSDAAESNECPCVILVDDRKLVLSGGLPVLEEVMPNANITGFTSGKEALEYARSNRVALAFLDIELRGGDNGIDLCKALLEVNPRTNVVFLTAYGEYSLDAWKTGASGFMLKPITAEGVKEQLQKLRYPFFIGEGKA